MLFCDTAGNSPNPQKADLAGPASKIRARRPFLTSSRPVNLQKKSNNILVVFGKIHPPLILELCLRFHQTRLQGDCNTAWHDDRPRRGDGCRQNSGGKHPLGHGMMSQQGYRFVADVGPQVPNHDVAAHVFSRGFQIHVVHNLCLRGRAVVASKNRSPVIAGRGRLYACPDCIALQYAIYIHPVKRRLHRRQPSENQSARVVNCWVEGRYWVL
jgi:hypothetical protein